MASNDFDRFEFTTEAPEWVDLPSQTVDHVGVIEYDDERTFYKAILQLENGNNRLWAWDNKNGRLPYGPELPPKVLKMLVAAVEE